MGCGVMKPSAARAARMILTAVTTIALGLSALAFSASSASSEVILRPETAVMLQGIAVDEKLAHDVYTALESRYPNAIFDNIADSEARHQEAVRDLMLKHAVVDPTAGDAIGSFDDPEVQSLHNDLVAKGLTSLTAAAEVGVWIEEFDIADLTDALAAELPKDVRQVLTNLLDASRSHLASFEELLTRSITLEPVAATTQLRQTAEVRAQERTRYQVGTTLLLALRPVRTNAGMTVRWRATTESREMCRVRTRNGKSTVTLLRPGTCLVVGYAPPPTPEYAEYRVTFRFRAVGTP